MILILGGTAEARALAARLVEAGEPVVSSLAGAVSAPRLPPGEVRIGGFGGAEGLAAYLAGHGVERVIDATHPFAEGMSANAEAACRAERVPLLRLERPGWEPMPQWRYVEGHEEAARLAADLGRRPFLTVGRQELGRFLPSLRERPVLARMVERPDLSLPHGWTLVTSRGPYLLADEMRLMRDHAIDVLVTKDSGGSYTWPKLEAAAILGVAVIVVRRPAAPAGLAVVHTAQDASAWVRAQSRCRCLPNAELSE